MRLTYLFRSPGTGHSIEELFGSIQGELTRQPSRTVNALYLPYISRGLRSVWENLRFVARRSWPGLVHVTGDIHYAVLAVPRSRTVLTIHDCSTLEVNRHRPLRYGLFWLFWFYLPVRRAAVVTTISEKTRQELRRNLGRVAEKTIVIPNGYDPAFVHNPQPFDTQKPTLLHIGTAPHKNLNRLIDAIDGLPCRLLIVGDLSVAQTRKLTHCQVDYENHVAISRARMVSLYERCHIVVFVSLYEGFGMPLLEAQAVGRPVVASRLMPMTALGGAGGACYVNPTDVEAIRRGIGQVWQDATYRDQLTRAGRLNAEQYTVERIAAQYDALYQQLTNGCATIHDDDIN